MLGAVEDEDRRVRLAHLEEKIIHPRSVLNVDSLLVGFLSYFHRFPFSRSLHEQRITDFFFCRIPSKLWFQIVTTRH